MGWVYAGTFLAPPSRIFAFLSLACCFCRCVYLLCCACVLLADLFIAFTAWSVCS